MKHRNPFAVFFLPFITLGIYALVWQVKTKGEMNKLGATIPTAWLLIVPIVNIWWLWKYSEGVDKVTAGKMSGVLAFVLLFLLGTIGAAIIQSEFNEVGQAAAPVVADASSAAPVEAAPTDTPEAAPSEPAASSDTPSDAGTNPTPPAAAA